jgi:hypothetical protein
MPVSELFERVSVQEFCHWKVFAEEEGLPSALNRYVGGATLALMRNGFGGSADGEKYEIEDFMNTPWADVKPENIDESSSFESLKQFVGVAGGR